MEELESWRFQMGAIMSTPTPFAVAHQAGTNFANSFAKVKDENAIESILSKAMSSGSPEVLQNSIGQILSQVSPERQGLAVQYLQNAFNNMEAKNEKQRLLSEKQRQREGAVKAGLNPDLPEALQIEQFKQNAKGERLRNALGGNQFSPALGGQAEGSPTQPQSNLPQQNVDAANPFSRFSDGQLVSLSGSEDKEISEPAKQELKRRQEDRNISQKREDNKIKFGQDIGKKVLERSDEIAEGLPQKESALGLMVDAIANKNLGFWSWDNLAEITGIEGLRSPEGAIFKTAAKEYFLGNIARAGARPNQWIEQQISDMLTKVGRSTEANLSVARALQNELSIEKERVRLTQEISDEIANGDGDYRRLGARVSERLSKFAEQKQNELFNDLRAIKSISDDKPQKFHKVQPGTQITPYMVDALLLTFDNDDVKALEEAKKLGYAIDE